MVWLTVVVLPQVIVVPETVEAVVMKAIQKSADRHNIRNDLCVALSVCFDLHSLAGWLGLHALMGADGVVSAKGLELLLAWKNRADDRPLQIFALKDHDENR